MNDPGPLQRFKPAVPNRWLLLLAGLLWTGVGLVLCFRAWGWLAALHDSSSVVYAASGAAFAVFGNRYMFAGVARKNVLRISLLPEHPCLFAFAAWKGYAMITAMIILGITLRNSSIPKHYLAFLYVAMGGALFLSSSVFYKSFWLHRHRS